MAKLYFYYGTMNSSKTAQALMTKYNYESTGREVLLLTSDVDTRSDGVESRTGMYSEALKVSPNSALYDLGREVDIIIVDEVQFFSEQQIVDLAWIADNRDIPVICYGLKSTWDKKLFESSAKLFVLADELIEIKTVCAYCDHRAVLNRRLTNDDSEILIGGDESYVPTCRRCHEVE